MAKNVVLPSIGVPVIDRSTGYMSDEWYQFFESQVADQVSSALDDVDSIGDAITNLQSTKADLNSPEFTGTPTAPTPAAGDDTDKLATTEFVMSALDLVGFSATKGGTDQTGLVSAVFTKLSFTTEEWDAGGYYDAANSEWTPPSSYVRILANARVSTANLDSAYAMTLQVFKNGVALKAGIVQMQSSTRNLSCGVDVEDLANGTDVYDIRLNVVTVSGTATVQGAINSTYFQGQVLGR